MYIYGKNVVLEYLNTGKIIKQAFIYKNFDDERILSKLKCDVKVLDKKKMDEMVHGMHQGIIVEVESFKYSKLDGSEEFIVILDHIEDPHNFGAIIRTAEAAGVDTIIIPKDRSVLVTPTVIKVSTGAINNVKIVQVTNLVRTMSELKDNGFWIVGTNLDGTPYDSIDYRGKTAIVIGNEGKGMSKSVTDNCDFLATIPMIGTTNSLNASVSAGIMIYEALKVRRDV